MSNLKSKKYIFVLLAILAVAVFFRFWHLSSIPPGVYPDEAINANQAISEPGRIFYPENNGREGLFINLLYLSFSLFSISIWSLKFISALVGVLTVFALYLLTKELFSNFHENDSRKIGVWVFSCFLLAVSFWHVNFSRIAFRAILVPFFLVFLFYFLFRGFRTQKISNFIIAGVFFGLGFHTYIAYRLAGFLVILVLILWWIFYRKQGLQKRFWRFAICFLLFAIIVALPLGIYFLKNPQDFISRAAGVSIFNQENPIKAFGKSLVSHLLMFNFRGDGNWRHNIAGEPVLFWPVGILFLIGIAWVICKTIKATKNKNYPLLTTNYTLLSWWFIMLLPGILTIEGIPHSLRTIGASPPSFIFAGIGGYFVYSRIKKFLILKPKSLAKIGLIFSLFILSFAFVFAQYWRYFWLWGKNPEVEGAFAKNYVELGNYLNSFPEDFKKYVIVNQGGVLVNGIPMPSQTVEFIERTKYKKPKSVYLLPKDIEKIKIEEKGTVIALMSYDKDLLNKLSEKFPKAILIYAQ
jgi:4-amino-4-deoxy-L-arabinose transferase-like glycosyltransferase